MRQENVAPTHQETWLLQSSSEGYVSVNNLPQILNQSSRANSWFRTRRFEFESSGSEDWSCRGVHFEPEDSRCWSSGSLVPKSFWARRFENIVVEIEFLRRINGNFHLRILNLIKSSWCWRPSTPLGISFRCFIICIRIRIHGTRHIHTIVRHVEAATLFVGIVSHFLALKWRLLIKMGLKRISIPQTDALHLIHIIIRNC